MPPIIFFGTEAYSLITLKALYEAGFPICAVITKPDMRSGRGHKLTEPPVKTFARQHGILVWQPNKLRDIIPDITALQPVAGVLVAYGKIIPQSIIDLFTPGIINLHPSLLPTWRGPSPIEAAIAHQDSETGISIMQLDAQMDAGPIYTQHRHPLTGTETKPQLYDELFAAGSDLLVRTLPSILAGTLQPTPQNDTDATYCQLLSKDMSLIDPTAMTAAAADAHVRAYLGFPRSRLRIHDRELIITKTRASNAPESPLSVKCCDGRYLAVLELIAPSGKQMTAEAFLRGHQG
ncbi:methionyl-tRNA formyltransferase [Candidatus Saccharibacteria bacterium oral taxon 488]|nr:methionyl-tRNA formyltransferase [Candidatus Saccharibacteria bacterium oral taxon 488]